jgi:MerR family transcriptional regulator, thiopeptide resistance regulator
MLLKVGELARRTGLTVRTLHHYDEIGLLAPSARSDAGYRLYDGRDIERLYHVMALSGLGLPLARVKDLMQGSGPDIAQVIEQQIAAINAQIEQGALLRQRLLQLQAQFAQNDEPALSECLKTLELMSIYEKYFTQDEMAQFRERKRGLGAHIENAQQEWTRLIAAVRQQMTQGAAPDSDAARRLARRWQELAALFAGEDPAIHAEVAAMYRQESAMQRETGIDAAMFEFIRLAMQRKNHE